jgi:hypothetical protein
MKKTFAVMMALGLLAGALIAPADAAKKKKKKKVPSVAAEAKFFMHWDDDGAGGCAGMVHMDLEDKPDPGSGCEFVAQPANEVLIATGQGLSRDWPASAGLPLVLDASRKIVGEISIRGAAGRGTVEVVLSGTVGDESVELGTASAPFQVVASGQTGAAIASFEIQPDAALNMKSLTSLNLNTMVRGVTAATYIDLDNPPSFVTIPSFTS